MKTTLTIQGTHCAACKALIEDVAKDTKGIHACEVDFKTGTTDIEYDESVDWAAFKKEIESFGDYKVNLPLT